MLRPYHCQMNLSYVISTQPTRFAAVSLTDDFASTIAHLAKLGYDGVELAVRDPKLLDITGVRNILERHKLRVPAIGTGQAFVEEGLSFTDPDPSVRERAIARIESHIAMAKQLAADAPLVIIGLIRGRSLTEPENILPLQDALTRSARAASVCNVRLAIEPINRYETSLLNTVAETLALIQRVDADNLGVLFDTFHANIEEESIESSLKACGARLFHVHVADSNRWAPGYGHTDFTSVISTLQGMQYNGWVSAEILQKPNVDLAMQTAIKTMRKLMTAS